jgi:hypothetical protein
VERKTIAYAVIAVGVLMALLALLADALGIGAEGFGWRRGALLAAGALVVVAGVVWLVRPPGARPPSAGADGEDAGGGG